MSDVPTPQTSKRKKTLFRLAAEEFDEILLNNVLRDVTSSEAGCVAVGIDMAAQEGNWGLSIITADAALLRGTLRLMLPHHFELDGFKLKHLIKPSGAFVSRLMSVLIKHGHQAAIGVDVPFGWPQEHASFVNSWSAVSVPGQVVSPPTRSCFEFRLCDRAMMQVLKGEGRNAAVLAVGADKIASASFRWATQRLGLPGSERVDVGYDPPVGGGVVYFETYPSAFVRLNYPSFAGYKTLKLAKKSVETAQNQSAERQARHDLLDSIRAEYQIDTTHCASALEAACKTSASDAYDGFLSAITAWDYLKWRTQQAGTVRMSSPTELLGSRTAATEKARIEKEGWFLVRLTASDVAPHEKADNL